MAEMDCFFPDYNWIEKQIFSFEKELKALGITDIVCIMRGGMFVAFLASQITGVRAIHPIYYDKFKREIRFDAEAEITADSVVLLCEDVVGAGQTTARCLAYLKERTPHVKVLTIHHYNGSTLKPDFGFDAGDTIFILPWERHVFNPEMRDEYREAGGQLKGDDAYFKYGSDLDGVFLADLPEAGYRTDLENTLKRRAQLKPYGSELHPQKNERGWHIVTGRSELDRESTEQWLREHGIAFEKILLRDPAEIDIAPTDESHAMAQRAALSKVKHIQAEGITHFYESDPVQAIFIAAKLPMVRVYWWNNELGVRKLITATDCE